MINITLPDGSVHQHEAGVTPLDIAKSISEGLARNVLSAKVNDKVTELYHPINEDATVQLLTWNDEEGKETFWHTSAHLRIMCCGSPGAILCAAGISSFWTFRGRRSQI